MEEFTLDDNGEVDPETEQPSQDASSISTAASAYHESELSDNLDNDTQASEPIIIMSMSAEAHTNHNNIITAESDLQSQQTLTMSINDEADIQAIDNAVSELADEEKTSVSQTSILYQSEILTKTQQEIAQLITVSSDPNTVRDSIYNNVSSFAILFNCINQLSDPSDLNVFIADIIASSADTTAISEVFSNWYIDFEFDELSNQQTQEQHQSLQQDNYQDSIDDTSEYHDNSFNQGSSNNDSEQQDRVFTSDDISDYHSFNDECSTASVSESLYRDIHSY